ncbi:MAG: flagellin [Euryarchaeota archaeon]|nr:flagellin [Euryarchaeota archaeon]
MKKMISEEQGEFGIGSLIIFIAMIIVAAVTATLLINTAYQLQQQAQQTSQEALQDVSTGVKIISIGGYRYNLTWGTEPPYRDTLDWLTVKITPIAGSPPVNISDLVVVVSDGYLSTTLSYSPTLTFSAGANPPQGSGVFGAKMIRNLPPTAAGVLTQGDIAEIYFNATAAGLSLQEQTQFTIRIIPRHGVPAYEQIITPSPYIGRYVELI